MIKRTILALTAVALAASCKVTRTIPQTATSPLITFESTMAAQTFYEAVIGEQFPDPEGRSLTLALAPLDIQKDKVRDSGLILTDAFSRADSNADGKISEAEAKYFAASVN